MSDVIDKLKSRREKLHYINIIEDEIRIIV